MEKCNSRVTSYWLTVSDNSLMDCLMLPTPVNNSTSWPILTDWSLIHFNMGNMTRCLQLDTGGIHRHMAGCHQPQHSTVPLFKSYSITPMCSPTITAISKLTMLFLSVQHVAESSTTTLLRPGTESRTLSVALPGSCSFCLVFSLSSQSHIPSLLFSLVLSLSSGSLTISPLLLFRSIPPRQLQQMAIYTECGSDQSFCLLKDIYFPPLSRK